MKLEERKQNSFIQKSIFLLIIMTLWICLGTGFTVNAAQREDTKLLKIYDGKSIEASQIQFKAEVATPDSNRIDIYRSEKPVSQGGKLEKLETFSPEDELDFNVYFNISKEGEEITNYSILINNPKVNMHKVKALLIHNYIIDEAYPSIGIMDKPVELLKDNNNKIELKGKIQTSENISNVKYKLYIEYTTDDGKENKIYYDVKRG